MTRCPNCFQEMCPDRYAWLCSSFRCEPREDEVASRYSAVTVLKRPVIDISRPAKGSKWTAPGAVYCEECGVRTNAQVCPECHWGPLLGDWRSANTTCIAMAGARQTGKSFYVCIIIKQLEMLCVRLHTTLDFADEQTRSTYERFYEGPLLKERGLIPPTPSSEVEGSYQRDPMLFSMGMLAGGRHYLVLRDVAGEELESDTSRSSHLRFFAHADGVLFMFDPLGVPEIAAQLRDLMPQGASGGDPQIVLSNVLRLMGTSASRIAVILSKFDAMEALRNVQGTEWSVIMSNSGAGFLRDVGRTTTGYDEADGELVHHEVRSLLLKLNAQSLVLSVERPSIGCPRPYRFFAVSTLGEAPRGDRVHARGITPHRCLDPLKWVLSGTGAI